MNFVVFCIYLEGNLSIKIQNSYRIYRRLTKKVHGNNKKYIG